MMAPRLVVLMVTLIPMPCLLGEVTDSHEVQIRKPLHLQNEKDSGIKAKTYARNLNVDTEFVDDGADGAESKENNLQHDTETPIEIENIVSTHQIGVTEKKGYTILRMKKKKKGKGQESREKDMITKSPKKTKSPETVGPTMLPKSKKKSPKGTQTKSKKSNQCYTYNDKSKKKKKSVPCSGTFNPTQEPTRQPNLEPTVTSPPNNSQPPSVAPTICDDLDCPRPTNPIDKEEPVVSPSLISQTPQPSTALPVSRGPVVTSSPSECTDLDCERPTNA